MTLTRLMPRIVVQEEKKKCHLSLSPWVKGVKASANLYSLIETAKANGLEPYAYLRHVFTELPKADTVEAIEALLPGNMDQIKTG